MIHQETVQQISTEVLHQSAISVKVSPKEIDSAVLAHMIDHTLLKPDAMIDQVQHLCEEARQYQFAAVCVNPSYVSLCSYLLAGSYSKVCTVIGFPFGATSTASKEAESEQALRDGARELDIVIHIGRLHSKDYDYVEKDVAAVVQRAHHADAIVKVIIETSLLSQEEKIAACVIAKVRKMWR
jgi:deoxyribose-phosphate aldolase